MAERRGGAVVRYSLLALSAGLIAVPAVAGAPGDDVVVTAPASEAIAVVPEPVATPASRWSTAAATELLEAVKDADAQGLRSADYHPAALRQAIERGAGASLDATASATATALAHDYLLGRVDDREALGWYIRPAAYEAAALPAAIDAAVAQNRVGAFLTGLLPSDPRYAALRDALADTNDPAMRDAIRVNLERWRWMPRALGGNYLYVNVPSYRLQVVDNGNVASTYTVVVGAPETPTPQLVSDASALVVNPWWNVPASIVKSAQLRPGRAGYVFKASAGGWQVRQPPGPRNSLGRLKFVLDNDQAIYLHDTPAKRLFARSQRALSHGCIRVQNIDQLASELMMDGGDPAALEDALAGPDTRTLRLPRNWPVYLVYFTVDEGQDGKIVRLDDPYGRDAAVLAKLDGNGLGAAMQVASN